MARTVTVRMLDHLKTEIRVGTHALLADEPADKGGTDAGPTPTELLLAALGA
jgi:putative redox protein